jgi:hypothetical protein
MDEATTDSLAALAESGAKPFTEIDHVVAQLGPVFAARRSEGS